MKNWSQILDFNDRLFYSSVSVSQSVRLEPPSAKSWQKQTCSKRVKKEAEVKKKDNFVLHPSLYPSIHHLLILPCISFLLFFPSWHQSHHSKCFIHLFLLPGLFILFLPNSPLSSLLYIHLHSLIVLPVCTFVIVAVNCCWLTDQFRTGRTLIYSFSAGKYKPGMCEDMRMHANTHTHIHTCRL